MWEKNYANFLVLLCSILSEGIGNLSEESAKDLLDFHLRRKRLIDNQSYGNRPKAIDDFPYVVSIWKNGVHRCTGSILEPHIILTAAHCVEEPENYRVLTGSTNLSSARRHKITRIIKHKGYLNETLANDLMLLVIFPNIDFEHSPNQRILLYDGDIPPNSFGTISSWGCIQERSTSCCHKTPSVFPEELRSITVPIISLDLCRKAYKKDREITNNDICTLDIRQKKRCARGDSGSPLVFNEKLVGVMSWSIKEYCLFKKLPDVFVNLSQPKYSEWVRSNIPHDPHYPYIRWNKTLVTHAPHIKLL